MTVGCPKLEEYYCGGLWGATCTNNCVREIKELVQLRHGNRQDCIRCSNVWCNDVVCSRQRLFVQSGMGEGGILGRSLTLIFVISSITNKQIYQKNMMAIGCSSKVPTSSYRYRVGIYVTSSCSKAFSSAVGTLPLRDYPLISIQKFQSSNCLPLPDYPLISIQKFQSSNCYVST